MRAYEHSGFILNFILDNDRIRFDPGFKDFELVLLNVFDALVKAVGIIPRVETKLYSEWVCWYFKSCFEVSNILCSLQKTHF